MKNTIELKEKLYTYTIFLDGDQIKQFKDQKGDFCVLKYMLDKQGNSMSYAFKYGGYSATVMDQQNRKIYPYNYE